MKQLFIIDGHFFLYRARHAYPPMSNRDGLSSNMIYGFWRMIIHLLALKPDNIIIVRDAPGRVHREDLLPSYKANRATMPDDFRQQTTLCKSLCVQLGIHSLEKSGYEADDIIYTLAKHRRNNNSL
jgi:DNA polymerase-1